MFAFEFQPYLLYVVFLPSSAMLHGPSSNRRPVEELQPGPPLSHRMSGASSGEVRDSKNLRNPISPRGGVGEVRAHEPEEQVLSYGYVKITAVLLHRGVAQLRLCNTKLIVAEQRVRHLLVCPLLSAQDAVSTTRRTRTRQSVRYHRLAVQVIGPLHCLLHNLLNIMDEVLDALN